MVGWAHYLGADEKYDSIQPEIADNEIVRNGEMQICICAQFEAGLTEIYLPRKTKFALREAILKKKFCFYGHFPYPP